MVAITPITTDDLTSGTIDGSGVFDEIMSTMQIRLEREHEKNRIKGVDYSKVYLGGMEAAMQQSILFLLGKDKAANEAALILAQIEKTEEDKLLTIAQTNKTNADTDLVRKNILVADQEILVMEQNVLKSVQEVLVLEQNVLESIEKVKLMQQEVINAKLQEATLELMPAKTEAETNSILAQISKTSSEIQFTNKKTENLISEGQNTEAQTKKIKQDVLNLEEVNKNLQKENTKIINESVLIGNRAATEVQNALNMIELNGKIKNEAGLISANTGKVASEKTLLNAKAATEGAQLGLIAEKISESKAQVDRLTQEISNLKIGHQKIIQEINSGYVKSEIDQLQTREKYTAILYDEEEDKLTATIGQPVEGVIKLQREKLKAEAELLAQRKSTEEAQIKDTVNTVGVTGVLGKQKNLYQAQTDGFERDAEQKLSKIIGDAFAVQYATNEGTGEIPKTFTKAGMESVLVKARQGVGAST